jgi:eukaryotic-like serine/threonine-protein kinase
VGPYEITGVLGAGGMGEVFRARDTKLRRDVAIKVLPESLASDPERRARFEREAQVLASLNHPNIGTIHGLEEGPPDAGQPTQALILELVDGPTLADRLEQGAIPLDEALPIARQIADALEAAHEHGVVHRDLKPSNIKLRPDGLVKVLDFGLAKLVEGPPKGGHYDQRRGVRLQPDLSQSPTITTPAMTLTGVILGTAAYMSPEQAKGLDADPRSDVFAFGAVLYEMLTGRRAFAGDGVGETLAYVIMKDPDWSLLPATLPQRLRLLLSRCLTKDRRQRLQAIGEARIAIDSLNSNASEPSTASVSVPVRFRAWAGWAAAALVAGAFSVWLWMTPTPDRPLVKFQITAPAGSQLPLGTPVLSPDGRMIANVVAAPKRPSVLHVRNLGSTDSTPVPGTERVVYAFWSPDSRSLAFYAQGTIRRVDLDGGSPREIGDTGNVWSGSWNQQGQILFRALSGAAIRSAPASGGPATTVMTSGEKERFAQGPHFLADGRRFLVLTTRPDGESVLEVRAIDSTERTTLVGRNPTLGSVAATPDGSYLVYARDTTLFAHSFDESRARVVGEPTPIVDNIGRLAGPLNVPAMSVSPAGHLAYQVSEQTASSGRRAVWHNRSGEEVGEVAIANVTFAYGLSPNGHALVYSCRHRLAPTSGKSTWVGVRVRGLRSTSRHERRSGPQTAAAWRSCEAQASSRRTPAARARNACSCLDPPMR